MKSRIMIYINKLESYKTAIKNLHWSSKHMSEHKLLDDIASKLSEYQDEIAEIAQGVYGKIKLNELKPRKYTITNSKKMLNDILEDTKKFYPSTSRSKDLIGLRSVVETFLGDINKFQYLMDMCLKEDIKRNVNNKLNENKEMKKQVVRLTESDLHNIIKEAVNNALLESQDNDLNYTHFAINKNTNLIVNGWNYEGHESDELRQFKKDYFYDDLVDYGFDPKEYKILTKKACIRQGINPDDELNCWSNNGLVSLKDEYNQ